MPFPQSTILPKACVCGHDHTTERGEPISLCLECACTEEIPRCQNCGEEATTVLIAVGYDACSRRCGLQLEYAAERMRATA